MAHGRRAPLSDFSFVEDEQLRRALTEMSRTVDQRLRTVEKTLSKKVYTLSGVLTQLRTLDAAAGTASDVRSVLATLIYDLQNEKELLG